MSLNEKLRAEQSRLEQEISCLQEKLNAYPEGELVIYKNGASHRWHHFLNNSNQYLPKSEIETAKKLAEKKWICSRIADCKQELKAIQAYQDSLHQETSQVDRIMDPASGYLSLLKQTDLLHQIDPHEWRSEPYLRSERNANQLTVPTKAGVMVRSKTEAMIANALFEHDIAFRYECQLLISESIIYPDFTILHPETSAEIIWEHFGLIDNPSYYRNTLSKLEQYISHGFLPGVNLISTFETREHPLDIQYVESLIEYHFL